MGRKTKLDPSEAGGDDSKVKEVLQLLQKESRLNKDQVEFCNQACIERYLKVRSGNVKKAAKQLRASLSWRERLEISYLTADDFPAELAAGVAFVAGQDDNEKPVVILRTLQEFLPPKSQKRFLRFLVFTFEVAVASMPPGTEQWVMLIDFCGSSKASSSLLTFIMSVLKLVSEHYPERLAPSYFVDAPSMFYYLWKGTGPFMDHSTREKWSFVSLKDHVQKVTPARELLTAEPHQTPSHEQNILECPATPSFRYQANAGPSYEDRLSAMSFLTPLSSPGGQSFFKRNFHNFEPNSLGAALASDMQHRSLSFSSPANLRAGAGGGELEDPSTSFNDSPVFLRSSRSRRCSRELGSVSYLQRWEIRSSTSSSGSNNTSGSNTNKNTTSRSLESFGAYVKFCKTSYNESSYRAAMKPPLGGIVSVIKSALNHSGS